MRVPVSNEITHHPICAGEFQSFDHPMSSLQKFIVALSIVSTIVSAQQQRSFAATKFDLSPDLPAEDPVQISAQRDGRGERLHKPNRKHHVTKPVKAVPNSESEFHNVDNGPDSQTSQTQPGSQTLVPLRTLAPIQSFTPPQAPVTQPPFNPFTLATFVPSLVPGIGQPGAVQPGQTQFPATFPQQPAPQQPFAPFPQQPQPTQQHQFSQGPRLVQPAQPTQQQQFVQGPQIAQPQIAQPVVNIQGQFPYNQQQGFQQPTQFVQVPTNVKGVQQSQIDQPDIQVSRAGAERIDLWFRENYDTSICKRDSRFMANEFRLKFPQNLLRNGKDTVLSDLLAARLEDCFSKHDSNHWKRVDELLSGLSLAAAEEEECRSGLIQEQISCDNAFSYTCQFIQKALQLPPCSHTFDHSRGKICRRWSGEMSQDCEKNQKRTTGINNFCMRNVHLIVLIYFDVFL
ncbi:hypothetical protein M3Y97_00947200 [Aphelenchoides bicaudatus]|nr:hypothetical protein M3Y97_00947200 [Aphelenchoides bicaudatus]